LQIGPFVCVFLIKDGSAQRHLVNRYVDRISGRSL